MVKGASLRAQTHCRDARCTQSFARQCVSMMHDSLSTHPIPCSQNLMLGNQLTTLGAEYAYQQNKHFLSKVDLSGQIQEARA